MRDDHLIGWLCIMRHNLDDSGEGEFMIPTCVKEAMAARGWVEITDNWLHVTEKGTAVSDLAAPEWGIAPIPEML